MNEQQKELSLQANQPKAEKDYSRYFQRPSINSARKRSREQAHVHRDFVIEQSIKNIGKGKKYLIQTYGCQMNEHDSEAIIGIAEELGYSKAESQEEADLIILNTCAIRENAENRVFGELGRLKRLKRTNPDLILGVCGCMSQEEKVVNQIMEKYQYVDLVFGTHNIYRLPEYIHNALMGKERVIEVWSQEGEIIENMPRTRQGSIKAWVNIMYGCDNFCSYCIVPYVRGRERSRNPEDIINEIKDLVANGVVEIMLLGQNVNSYGKNLENPITFAQLLEQVEKIDGLKRIRFMTSHPKDLSDELIEVMAKSKKICKQMHLPLQSGSTALLQKMNRHYTKEQYLELVRKLREAIPDIGISTDIIVGFPGETEEDFLETLDVVKQAEYESAFTFIYSKRSGTPAAKMENQVSDDVIKDRFDRLLAVVNEISKKKTEKYQGTVQEVLIEEVNKKIPGYVTGRLSNNAVVHFEGNKEDIGQLVNVRLNEAKGFYYMGEIVR